MVTLPEGTNLKLKFSLPSLIVACGLAMRRFDPV